jgi:hypothetical protein
VRLPAHQLRTFALFVTGEYKVATDTPTGDVRRQQACWELNGTSVIAPRDDLVNASAVVLHVLLGCQIQAENKLLHGAKGINARHIHSLDVAIYQFID